eukprot:TRINITY_DN1953_c0_g1_i1.p3 TRINITY_DN1953_c0_g1~~TRINITY_DN1953_c0_g1_i1.p3  ORF type:complete len:57 (-),score=14.09 TRINITY_DN1953_c0_g1_i1:45-215(-)
MATQYYQIPSSLTPLPLTPPPSSFPPTTSSPPSSFKHPENTITPLSSNTTNTTKKQ